MPEFVLVLPPDLELFLTRWLRTVLRARGHDVQVGTRKPVGCTYPLAKPLVIIQDDGGPQTECVTFEHAVSVNVMGGTKTDAYATMTLAREIYGLLTSDGPLLADGSPIAAVDKQAGTNGVYRVPDDVDATVAFMTVTYRVCGEITN